MISRNPNAIPFRRAKIVCTLGPASATPAVIGNLIDEGMDVARLNFSHGAVADHEERVRIIREEAQRRGRALAILQDLQGPKIRVGKVTPGTVLEAGAELIITTEEILGTAERVSTTYKDMPRDVRVGDTMLIDDGLMQLEVLEVEGEEIVARVLIGGPLSNNKGINLPGVRVSAPSLSDKDHADLIVGQRLGVDFLALSFVRSPEDVIQAREAIARARALFPEAAGRAPTLIIAKIEKPEAIERLESIIDVSDGIMVARGDLGVELGAEKVPLVQKAAIDMTNAKGKLVITATQMLESMTTNPRPTRAEASDVANAVLDGTDALMLSAESASGRYPMLAVRTMATIIREVEGSRHFQEAKRRLSVPTAPISANAIAQAAVVASRLVSAPLIAATSDSGGVVRLLSEHRPEALVLGLTRNRDVYNQLAAYWGVLPVLFPEVASAEEFLLRACELLRDKGYGRAGDRVVLTMALPFGSGNPTNTLQIVTL